MSRIGRPRTATHGDSTMYQYHRCRCVICRMAHNLRRTAYDQQRGINGSRLRESQPEKAATWKRAVERGYADELADAIIHSSPMPDKLIRALARAPIIDEDDLG